MANQIERASQRTTLTCKLVPRLSAGIEYNPSSDQISALANWLALEERKRRPALIFGTSSDRIGTPFGQSYYATVSKSLKESTGWPVAPYAGAAYGTYDDRLRAIGGANFAFSDRFSAMMIFDGVHLHEMGSYHLGRHTFSLLLVRSHDPGLSYSVSF